MRLVEMDLQIDELINTIFQSLTFHLSTAYYEHHSSFYFFLVAFSIRQHTMAGNPVIDSISLTIICILGMILNAFEIKMLFRERKHDSPFQITLISLAISDLGFAAFFAFMLVLFHIVPSIATLQWYGASTFIVSVALLLSSSLHMLYIAIQRLLAVVWPLKFPVWITKRNCIITICLLWIISVVATIPYYISIFHKYILFIRIMQYSPLITGVSISLCYAILSYRIMTKENISTTSSSSQGTRVFLYSVCVTGAFIGSTFPYTIYNIIRPDKPLFEPLPIQFIYLFVLQVIFDPIIYFLFHYWKKGNCSNYCRRNCCGTVVVTT